MMYLLSGTSAPWTGQIIVTEEEPAGRKSYSLHETHWYEGWVWQFFCYLAAVWHYPSAFWQSEGIVPGRPLELQVTEATKNYVVLSWKPPGEKGLEGVMYYVEKVKNVLHTKNKC